MVYSSLLTHNIQQLYGDIPSHLQGIRLDLDVQIWPYVYHEYDIYYQYYIEPYPRQPEFEKQKNKNN